MAAVLRGELTAYLRAAGGLRFAWGTADCCTWVCDWVQQSRGVDPAARWRGRYRTARGAARQYRGQLGGFIGVVSVAMHEAGLSTTNDPQPGDIGVVCSATGDSLAIRTNAGWAGISERGLVVAPVEFIKAWSV